MKQETLMEIGMTKNEAEVYLALLELGSSSIGEIANKCKIHRPNVYDSLKKLMEKGIVSMITKNNSKYYQASDPAMLDNLLKEKGIKLQGIMPELYTLFNMKKTRSFANVYEGIGAVTKILDGMLKHNDDILVYGIPKVAPEMVKFFIMNFHKRRIEQKVTMKHIYNFNAMERINFLNKMPYTEAKYMPSEVDSLVATFVCGDEVSLIIWTANPKIIQIIDIDTAESYRQYFNLLWKIAKLPENSGKRKAKANQPSA
ncbi:MAG: helix-turn-helix domain-containing protein [Nanoarchaeota archaeon]|nr:helix-turn-helix domain-containing protein [Nanoarchaeota archaeon]